MNLDTNNLDDRPDIGSRRRVTGWSWTCCIDPRYQTGDSRE